MKHLRISYFKNKDNKADIFLSYFTLSNLTETFFPLALFCKNLIAYYLFSGPSLIPNILIFKSVI